MNEWIKSMKQLAEDIAEIDRDIRKNFYEIVAITVASFTIAMVSALLGKWIFVTFLQR